MSKSKPWTMEAILQKQLTVTGGAGKIIYPGPVGNVIEAPKPSKYRNQKQLRDGILFDSIKEADRYQELNLMQRYKQIHDLRLQVRYDFVIGGMKVCSYVADFVYTLAGKEIVEDVKSDITRKNRAYRIKCKLMKAIFNIEIKEI